ncbi:MAG: VWA domain-containing protein [Thermoflexales bacterium]|nr:VWA domain-containing protein [Thermoflexales bacterium]
MKASIFSRFWLPAATTTEAPGISLWLIIVIVAAILVILWLFRRQLRNFLFRSSLPKARVGEKEDIEIMKNWSVRDETVSDDVVAGDRIVAGRASPPMIAARQSMMTTRPSMMRNQNIVDRDKVSDLSIDDIDQDTRVSSDKGGGNEVTFGDVTGCQITCDRDADGKALAASAGSAGRVIATAPRPGSYATRRLSQAPNGSVSRSYYQASDIPIVSRSQPLPHDCLFVRRNNAFGTRSTLGIKDLIEQGVMIDQTNIRFDDFVASNGESVPPPTPGQAIAVSHGTSSVKEGYKYHEATTHYLEIALKAAPSAPESHSKAESMPVNYVFVVDTSGSMEGKKLDDVKVSIRETFQHMSGSDIIGIVEFNTVAKTVLKAAPKGKISLDGLGEALGRLHAHGGTDINLGLSFGADEIDRYGKPGLVNHLYLFTDGNPNSGETDWIKIRQNVANRTRGNIGLSIFGFGSDANMRELDALAGVTGGRSMFVTHPDEIRVNLRGDLQRREHLAAINIQMKIEIDQDIEILHLYGHDPITDPAGRAAVLRDVEAAKRQADEEFGIQAHPDIVTEEKGIRIFAPDLAVGETYWVVFELAIPAGREDSVLGKALVQYADTFERQSKRCEFELSATGAIPAETVLLHGLGLWTSEVTFYALDDLYQNDMETARKRMEKHIQVLNFVQAFYPSPQLVDDAIILKKFVSLAANLGKGWRSADSSGSGAYVAHCLNSFGQVRNGFMMASYYPV